MKIHQLTSVFLFVSFFLLSCSSDGAMVSDMIDGGPFQVKKSLEGEFVADAHPTSGKVSIDRERIKLSFKNFKTDDGPKLLVYLTPEVGSSEFINLGELKQLEGNFEYALQTHTDLYKYKKVVIWCVDFSVSFGHAELK